MAKQLDHTTADEIATNCSLYGFNAARFHLVQRSLEDMAQHGIVEKAENIDLGDTGRYQYWKLTEKGIAWARGWMSEMDVESADRYDAIMAANEAQREAETEPEISDAEDELHEVLEHILGDNADMEATFEAEIRAGYYPEIDPRPSLYENGLQYVEKPGLLADLYGADAENPDPRVAFGVLWKIYINDVRDRRMWEAREEELFRAFMSGIEYARGERMGVAAAAAAAGVNRSAVKAAITGGRLKAEKNASGNYEIATTELRRWQATIRAKNGSRKQGKS